MFFCFFRLLFLFFGFHDVAAVVDMVYQCSGRNDPVAKAESIQPLWVQLMDPASLDLAEGRPRVWAHSAERCAPWMHQNQAGFVYALSGSYYSPGPSQLIVCNRIAKGFVCLFSVLFIVFFVFWGIRYRATRGYGIQINWIGIKQGKNNICSSVQVSLNQE